MIEYVHNHIVEELRTNTKTDIVFIITAVFLNFSLWQLMRRSLPEDQNS